MLSKAVVDGDISFLNLRQSKLFLRTLYVGLGTTFLALSLGLLFSIFLERSDVHGKRFLQFFHIFPLLIPPYIYALTLSKILPKFFFAHGMLGTVMTLGIAYFPLVSIIVTAGLRSIDHKLEEAGYLAHNEWQVFKGITLPLLLPYILSASIIIFILAVSDYGVPALFQVNVYPVEIFITFGTMYDHIKGASMAVPLIMVAVVLVLLLKKCMGNKAYVTFASCDQLMRKIYSLKKWRFLAGIILFMILSVVVLVPLIFLLVEAGGWVTYLKVLKTSWPEITESTLIAIFSATVSVMVSFFIAYVIEKTDLRFKSVVDILSLIPFALPATVLGLGLILFWNQPVIDKIYSSSIILVIAYVTITSPLAVRILIANMKQINSHLEEAALVTPTRWWGRFKNIWLPLLSPGFKISWAVCFILSIRELGATLLIIPPGKESLSLKIYSLMHYGANKMVSALSIILLGLTIIPVIILSYGHFRKHT